MQAKRATRDECIAEPATFQARSTTLRLLLNENARVGDLSFFLGGKAESDDDKWQPDIGAVRATIQFALATKRFSMDR
ncbi:hypothetical protein HRG_014585 [Hirsutella rhossiliensis]